MRENIKPVLNARGPTRRRTKLRVSQEIRETIFSLFSSPERERERAYVAGTNTWGRVQDVVYEAIDPSLSYMATCSRDACVLFGRFYLATMHGVDSLGSMNSKGWLREPTREAGTFDWILLPFHLNIFEY